MSLCVLTGLACLNRCGGPDGNRCAAAPPYRNPLAQSGFADIGAEFGLDLAQVPAAATSLIAAQLGERRHAANPGASSHPRLSLALRIVNTELAERSFRGAIEQYRGHPLDQIERVQELRGEAEAEWRRQRRQAEEDKRRRVAEQRRRLTTAEIVTGERIGWRMWFCVAPKSAAPRLKSFARDDIWQPDRPMTGRPQLDDYAGVWAFREPAQALAKASEHNSIIDGEHPVWGAVALWGDTYEHQDGWRAEFARIVSIDGVLQNHPRRRYSERRRDYRRHHVLLGRLRRVYRVGAFAEFERRRRRQLRELNSAEGP